MNTQTSPNQPVTYTSSPGDVRAAVDAALRGPLPSTEELKEVVDQFFKVHGDRAWSVMQGQTRRRLEAMLDRVQGGSFGIVMAGLEAQMKARKPADADTAAMAVYDRVAEDMVSTIEAWA